MKSIYKNSAARQQIMRLYEEKLSSLGIDYQEIDVHTTFGKTRVIKTGNKQGPVVVLFHGINTGSPVALEAVKELRNKYLFYAVDTIGQATKSAETRIDIKGNDYALWADEVLTQLSIQQAHVVGISYGAYILQKMMIHKPDKLDKSILIVPSGLVNGTFGASMKKLTLPLIKFKITGKEKNLKTFLKAFISEEDEFMTRLQNAMLTGLNIDYRRPLLLQKEDVKHFTKPVYIMVAENDVFFPGDAAVKRATSIFKNLKGIHMLKGSKHMPEAGTYTEIQQKIEEWIG